MSTNLASRRKQTGCWGEQFVAEYVKNCLGWTVLQRNWRCKAGEIDIVAVAQGTLVAVEVRTRTTDTHGTALESVDARKLAQLRRLMPFLFLDMGLCHETQQNRVDVVGLLLKQGVVSRFVHVRDVLAW